jgi:hypothetical protein
MTFRERATAKKANRETTGIPQSVEDNGWEQALFPEELADAYTDRVMLALEEVEIEPARAEVADAKSLFARRTKRNPLDTSIKARVQRERAAKRYRRSKVWVAAVAAIALAGSTLVYTQPTLADKLRSLFAPEGIVDPGMKQAQEMGLLQIPGTHVTDQGYTVTVKEVIADSARMILGIDVYDSKGNVVDVDLDPLQTIDFNFYSGGDGTTIRNVPYQQSSGGGQVINRFEFDFTRPVMADKLYVHVSVYELNLRQEKIGGNWELSLEVDLKEANAQTLLTPLNQTYETPGGLQIAMKGAARTPSGGWLEFTTKLTEEAAKRTVNGANDIQYIIYHQEDEKGEEWANKSGSNYGPVYQDRWSGVSYWLDTFTFFPYDKQKRRFVLDGYVIREKDDAAVTMDTSQTSAEHPVLFEHLGDQIKFEGLHFGIPPTRRRPLSEEHQAYLSISGTINNDISLDTWLAIDENGKEYEMDFMGSFGGQMWSDLNELGPSFFIVKGLKTMPKQLTLKRTIVNHRYNDVNWSFDITPTNSPSPSPRRDF